jgi:phenylacetate-coenzyme A ligase PaaK-like adenylate-forming protein
MSGALASLLQEQVTADYLPPLDEAEGLPFEDRIKLGFQQALSQGLDFFFGLSLVLAAVGDKFSQSSDGVDIRPFLAQPKALLRLTRGLVKSKLARRSMLPKDLWSVKGIISSGLDSMVYKDKIKELWGRCPLDIYSSTEGGIIATQTWDYEGMTFIPSLNFFEFIPEDEHFKCKLDPSYQPKTLLLDELKAGQNYEIVITNFHGGALVRYRIGDVVRITALRNEKLGIDIPQMVFERRADDLIDFVFIRLTEKTIWQALEKSGIPYLDWTAYKEPGKPVLKLFIELKEGYRAGEADVAAAVREQIIISDSDKSIESLIRDDFTEMINFKLDVTLLPPGTFAGYTAQRQAEGTDLAHLKPPHINPSGKVLSLLLSRLEAEAIAAA